MPHEGTSNEYPQHIFLWRNKEDLFSPPKLMSTHNICFRGEIRKISAFLDEKKAPYLLLCSNEYPQYMVFFLEDLEKYQYLLTFLEP